MPKCNAHCNATIKTNSASLACIMFFSVFIVYYYRALGHYVQVKALVLCETGDSHHGLESELSECPLQPMHNYH